jgi:hypothetical protein
VDRVSLWGSMLALPEPKDKLDAMTTQSAALIATPGADTVNGPEDDLTDWPSIDWRVVEDDVRRLRQRIFTRRRQGTSSGSRTCRS